ncbi:hypothetical protein ACFZAR_41520 [Streptomyces sp. NPDC008222]|uniref:hypothetical protein n=1 Tax=Streptomyces sp. NPDC008222 TaxID=3364820 RepID=UPI0036EA7FAD
MTAQASANDLIQSLHRAHKRGDDLLDLRVGFGDVGVDPSSILPSKKAWCPVNASSSAEILPRIRGRASWASAAWERSSAISAADIAGPEMPKMFGGDHAQLGE